MTHRDDFDRTLTDWLRAEAPNEAPDRVLGGALQQTAHQPQRRGWLDRFQSGTQMGRVLRVSAVATVILAAAVVGLQFVHLTPDVGEPPSPVPSSAATPRPSPAEPTPPAAACPELPFTFESVSAVPVADRPGCFGAEELTLVGWVFRESNLGYDCITYPERPTWLMCILSRQPLAFGALPPGPYAPASQLLWVAADPAGPVGPIYYRAIEGAVRTNTWVEVTGHFDDPAAADCGPVGDSLRVDCAGTFVLTSVRDVVAPWPPLGSAACVNPPIDLVTLIFQTDSVACYGNEALTFDAILMGGPGAIDGPCVSIEPAWLGCDSAVGLVPTQDRNKFSPWLLVAVDPASGVATGELIDTNVRVTGHYDDPAAQTCRFDGTYVPAPTEVDWVATCRSTFVVTSIEPLEP
ncbi:MAG: hypothetical protein ACRDGH_05585 [Candidatus Limnocylindria bacterium]